MSHKFDPTLVLEAEAAIAADAASQEGKAAEAIKHDFDKLPVELLDPLWLEAVAEVLGFGARKYAAHNWRKGFKHTRLLGAALRHLLAWQRGQDLDPESGLPHLAHASCCLMFLTNLTQTRPDLDDRVYPKTLQGMTY
jgi:hypothetical protein